MISIQDAAKNRPGSFFLVGGSATWSRSPRFCVESECLRQKKTTKEETTADERGPADTSSPNPFHIPRLHYYRRLPNLTTTWALKHDEVKVNECWFVHRGYHLFLQASCLKGNRLNKFTKRYTRSITQKPRQRQQNENTKTVFEFVFKKKNNKNNNKKQWQSNWNKNYKRGWMRHPTKRKASWYVLFFCPLLAVNVLASTTMFWQHFAWINKSENLLEVICCYLCHWLRYSLTNVDRIFFEKELFH